MTVKWLNNRYVKGLQYLTARVNMNCHFLIRFFSDSYGLHCKPSMSLIARCCWQPNKSSTQRASDLTPCYIWCLKLASPLFEPSGCVVIVVIALWWAVEGYRVMSLSSRSWEEMRRRCMVRVMFNRWLLPHTQPSESARQNDFSSPLLQQSQASLPDNMSSP